MNSSKALKSIGKTIGGTLGEGVDAALKITELNNARLLNNTQYGWVTDYLQKAGAPQTLIEKIAQKPENGTYGTVVDTRLGGALSIGLRDGDFMVGSLLDNPEYGNYKPSHRLASEVTRQYSVRGYDDVYAATKGVEAFETAESVGYDGLGTNGPASDLSVEDFTSTINTRNPYNDPVYASYLEKQGEFYGLTQNQYTTPTLSRPNYQTPAQLKRSRHGQRPQIAKTDLLADYQYPSRAFYAMERNFAVDKNNYAGPSQELSPQDVMSVEENAHLAALGRAHLNAKRAESYFAGEFVSAEENRKARAKASKTPTAPTRAKASKTPTTPTTDVITAEDGHLIGFAERHGLGWRDVWELNKETIPNPNAVQAGTTLNLPSKRSAYKAPDANAFMSTQAAAKRRVQTQPRFNAGGLYSDYLSPRSQPAAKRTASRKANTAGFNMDLLSTSVNKAARGNYGVTLGGWSPVGGSPAAVQKTAPKPKSDPDLMAVDKRTAQQLAKAVRTEQAAARNAGSLMDNAHSNRASAKEDTLDDIDIGVDTALNARAAKVDKLGESITTWGGERRVGGTPVQTSEDDAISKATAKRERAVNDPNTKPIGWVNDRGEKINDPRTPLDIATVQISQGQGAWGRSTGYNDFQTLASSLTRSGQHGDVGVSDLTSHGTIRGSQQSNMLAEQDKGLFGDSDSGGGNSRVICTELVRQGLMAPRLQRLDIAYTLRHLSPATVRGYHAWAVPYVQLMKRSNLATRLVEPLARWRAEEIAFRMKSRSRPHYRGRAVRWLGEPVCWVLGTVLGWVGDPNRFQPWTEPQQ